jgi:DNA primase small subunit
MSDTEDASYPSKKRRMQTVDKVRKYPVLSEEELKFELKIYYGAITRRCRSGARRGTALWRRAEGVENADMPTYKRCGVHTFVAAIVLDGIDSLSLSTRYCPFRCARSSLPRCADRLFPTSFLFHWLSTMSPVDGLKYREMSFTLPGDIYVRYCSYLTKESLKNDLVTKLPLKIDIGAIYNAPPSMHASLTSFVPIAKELVFDIDMTDYDDIRACCSGAAVCNKCWVIMSAAIKVIHVILSEDFGFEHILWVFSGRRGVHVWICDTRARRLSNEGRMAIVDFISVYLGKEKKVPLLGGSIHPMLTRAYIQLLPYFEDMLESQGWMDTNEKCAMILEYFDTAIRAEFIGDPRDEDQPGLAKWATLQAKVKTYLSSSKAGGGGGGGGRKYTPAAMSVRSALMRIVFGHVYPRLDVNVSKDIKHLLKSPFCVHPKTGKVCVPIDPTKADGFECDNVPVRHPCIGRRRSRGARVHA